MDTLVVWCTSSLSLSLFLSVRLSLPLSVSVTLSLCVSLYLSLYTRFSLCLTLFLSLLIFLQNNQRSIWCQVSQFHMSIYRNYRVIRQVDWKLFQLFSGYTPYWTSCSSLECKLSYEASNNLMSALKSWFRKLIYLNVLTKSVNIN